MNISKTAILPIVAVVCGGVGIIIGHPIGADTVDMIATISAVVIGGGVNIWGIVKNHKKVEAPAVQKPVQVAQPVEAPKQ